MTIDDDLLAQVKVLAARSRRPVSSLLEDALREMLERGEAHADQAPVRLTTYGSVGLRPGVDLTNKQQVAELLGDNVWPR